MTHRERIIAALKHQSPDRVPLDLGATFSSSINRRAYAGLRELLGFAPEPEPGVLSFRGAIVVPAEDVARRFGIDTCPLLVGTPDSRPDRHVSADAYIDEWGVTWSRPHGGHYINTDGPFQKMAEPTLSDLEAYDWPDAGDPGRYRGLRDRALRLHQDSDRAVVLNLWVGPVHLSQFLRGFSAWLEDLLINPVFAEALLARIADFWVDAVDQALREAGEFVDLVVMYDDIGTQKAPLIRPELYRRLIKPHHRRMTETVKKHGKAILWHTCGAVYQFIPDLIDMGIDALNPVQVSAAGMEPSRLKREFGRDLVFWGGVDTGKVLPLGTPADVRDEVRRRIGELSGSDGAYVLCAVHNIQADVPPANVIAMYDAALESAT
jgi:uroporphyrinogen decarboxylase